MSSALGKPYKFNKKIKKSYIFLERAEWHLRLFFPLPLRCYSPGYELRLWLPSEDVPQEPP